MAIGPIDYTSQFQQPNITQSIASGYQLGAGIRQDLQQQQQAQLAQQQAAQYQADVQAAMASPTPQNFSTLALKYPQQREAIKQSWDQLSEGERKEEGDVMAQSYSALLSNRPDIAKTVLQKQIDARKNAGSDASQYENALAMVESKPQEALAALGFTLSHIGDPKAFASQFAALGKEQREQAKAPAELLQATAEAEQKNASVIGSKLGALAQAKSLKPSQVETAFKSMAAQGLIPKDQLPEYIASIPTKDSELREYLNSFAAAGMKPEDQLKFTTPDANARLSAQTQESAANIAAATAANRLAYDKEQPKGQIIQTDSGPMLVDPRGGNARAVMGPDGAPLQPKLKSLPAPIQKALLENDAALRKVNKALDAVEKYPDALGATNYLGDTIRQRTDPKGVQTRALVADIGSLKIHDRSGAAVTAAETPRLKPFIPAATDNPETVKKKLDLFKQEYEAIQEDINGTYTREQGYRVPEKKANKQATPGIINFGDLK